jgi:hypothetical protein
MIDSFFLKNMETGQKITFGQDVDSDCLFNDGDIDWGTVGVSHDTFSFPNQTGVSISSTQIKDRDVTINAYVYYIPNENEKAKYKDAINDYIYQMILQKKKILNKFINPNQIIRIVIDDYYIEGKPSSTVKWSTKYKENNTAFCKFQISLYCSNPTFVSDLEIVTMSGSLPSFKFPLIIPEKGIILGERINYHTYAILNEGDVSIGAVFKIKSNGVVKGLKVENVTAGEYFKIDKTLQKDEEIIVDTSFSEARSIYGYIDGEEINYFKYWDYEGNWLQFPIGQSYITYSLDEGDVQSVDFSIELKLVKFDIEGE